MNKKNKMESLVLRMICRILLLAGILSLIPQTVRAQKISDPPFRVKIDFNRWHDVEELYSDLRRMQQAWPKLLKTEVVGRSQGGHDILLVTINNPETGPESSKAAMYIEANVHGNEIQGGEICLYTAWYLMENYGRNDRITRLVNERVFYLFPTVNPDGRDYFLKSPAGRARSGHVPLDEDNDYQADEDQPDDLNGNGVVEQIRKYLPGKGNFRPSAADARQMEPVPAGEKGDYLMLGLEGYDSDHDGRIDEDDLGGYDPNRNYPSDWQPNYVQGGAMDYPTQLPEARLTVDFFLRHPNIAGVQSYHNSGGMILRGPGAETTGEYPPADARVYDELGKNGERILPFYRYLIIWSGLYSVHGGFLDFTNDGVGVLSFSNELWNEEQYFTSPELKQQQKDPGSPISGRKGDFFFNDRLEFMSQFLEWKPFRHPQFGEVEIGGVWRKLQGRIPPRFMNEELCHRNMAFSLYQADEMPLIGIGEVTVDKVNEEVSRILIDIVNPKTVPTILERPAKNNVVRPDLLLLEGKKVEVLAAGWIGNREIYKIKPEVTELIDQKNLKRILSRNGFPGKTTRSLIYFVKGSGEVTFTYDSLKGGTARQSAKLPQ